MPLSLLYETTGAARRTLHPHVLFRAANGTLCVDGYQVAGATWSGERLPDWRQMDLTKISATELLDGTFETAPGFHLDADKYATGLIAHV